MEKHIALIVGHTDKAQGAVAYTGESEYKYNTCVASLTQVKIEHAYDARVTVFTRDAGYDFINNCLKDDPAYLSLELHFNSFKKPAFGIEILHLSDQPGFGIADTMTDILAQLYGMNERGNDGVKDLTRYERGAYCLRSVEHAENKLLIEPCFANFRTNQSEQFFEEGCLATYAQRLASALATACKLKPKVEGKPIMFDDLLVLLDSARMSIDNVYDKILELKGE
jgi:hypothetical protein